MNEHKASSFNGVIALLILLVLLAGCAWWLVISILASEPLQIGLSIVCGFIGLFLLGGLFIVKPNQSAVLQLFGRYVGSERRTGLRWSNPFYSKQVVSLRLRNFESSKLKVNDFNGNPVEIATIVVWKVVDTAEAVFCVDDYESFVRVQSESALRQMAQSYPYDADEAGQTALRSHGDVINDHLKNQIQERLAQAGVEVVEARISHLAYAQEIAQAMLQRQQASAIVAAREQIVEGAVSMVGMALDQLQDQNVVELDQERRAAMISNLLVVLCSDRAAQPVVNSGSLY